ncbi:YadA family autotransporter adhesin [Bradyrhizobium sp. HKCCYLS20291]|uniref:YadA family autotransporter adhesin n=1 Tax=Bradyrhizobium sp. HKCCYLS20291 TaxID=3420766 RepID=UPI003EBFBC6A
MAQRARLKISCRKKVSHYFQICLTMNNRGQNNNIHNAARANIGGTMGGKQFFKKSYRLRHSAFLLVLLGSVTLPAIDNPASAQFVCGGSATGSAPVSGSGSSSANQHDVTCGISSVAQGAAVGTSGGATSLGFGAFALGANSTTIGSFAGASTPAAGVTSIGANANATGAAAGTYSTAIGAGADPNTGNQVQSTGNYSVAIGGGDGVGANAARSLGNLSVAIGGSTVANAANSTVVGSNSSVAVGSTGSAVFGTGNTVNGTNAVSIGTNSTVTGNSGIAIGDTAQATGVSALAIGTGATAGFAGSTAIGAGATTTAVNQVSIGTATNTYKMAGLTSAASLAAQTGATSFVTTDAAGNLAATSFSPGSFQTQINSLSAQITDNRLEARTGTAIALAAGSMPALLPGRKFALSAGYGNFQGANAFAIGGTALIYETKGYAIVGNAGAGIGLERNVAGGRGAVSVQW